MDWQMIISILLTICAGAFAIGTTIIIAEDKERGRKIREHLSKLPKHREDMPGHSVSKGSPDLGTGKFDKQRVVYRDGDNT
jgi:hypothetical protein